jgi:hypothetical protein
MKRKNLKALVFILLSSSAIFAEDLKVEIPEGQEKRVIEGLAKRHGWKPFVQNEQGEILPNSLTKKDFANEVLKSFVLQSVADYEGELAAKAAKQRAFNLAAKEIFSDE